jgi:hypothetical protein
VTPAPLLVATLLGAVVALGASVPSSGADLTSTSSNPGNTVTGDRPGRYLHGYSQATDPTGLTPYAAVSGTPLLPAATGTDSTLTVNLGSYKNVTTATITRVLVVAAPSSLPSGITAVTVRIVLAADPASGLQPITATTFAAANGTGTCSGSTVTLAAGNRCQLNLTVSTRVNQGFVNNASYTPVLYLIANFPGYTGSSFLDYPVPIAISTA